MKQKRLLIAALVFLLAGIAYMFWDMFSFKPAGNVNPYAFDMKTLRGADTLKPAYDEVLQIMPSMKGIHGISVDRSDRIFIAGDEGVEIYDAAGKRLQSFPASGPARCISVSKDGMVYLGIEDHMAVYSADGKLMKQWKSCGPEAIITSVSVSGDDVYLADAGYKIVYRFDRAGNLQKKIGEKDPRDSIPGFVVPSPYFDLGMGPDGLLWVVNPGRHLFEKFTRDGALVATWGKASMAVDGFCGCCNPAHFAFLSDGCFVTSEKSIERIKVYTPAGALRSMVALPGSFTEGTRGLDLAVDSKDRILVLDPERNQVRIFVPKKPQ